MSSWADEVEAEEARGTLRSTPTKREPFGLIRVSNQQQQQQQPPPLQEQQHQKQLQPKAWMPKNGQVTSTLTAPPPPAAAPVTILTHPRKQQPVVSIENGAFKPTTTRANGGGSSNNKENHHVGGSSNKENNKKPQQQSIPPQKSFVPKHKQRVQNVSESDLFRRLQQRQKQIDFGKNTPGYTRYLEEVTKNSRQRNHPRTPDIRRNCSKRSWDGQVRVWRRALHLWDPVGDDKEEREESNNNNDDNIEEEDEDQTEDEEDMEGVQEFDRLATAPSTQFLL